MVVPPHVVPLDVPGPYKTASCNVGGRELEVTCYAFADRTLVLLTQLGKIGYLVRRRC